MLGAFGFERALTVEPIKVGMARATANGQARLPAAHPDAKRELIEQLHARPASRSLR